MKLYGYAIVLPGVVDPVETLVNANSNCTVEKAGKVKCKLKATMIDNVKGLSVVVLVA